jgi:cell division protein FtsQ
MKRKSILKRQAVRRKRKKRDFSRIWKIMSLSGSCFFKFLCLGTVLVSISLLFLYVYQYLLTCPNLKLEDVVVTGVEGEIMQELLQMSGLSPGSSLLAISLKEVKRKIEKHPWVRFVELEKRFPHTLVVRVKEEAPSAIVLMDRLYYMDDSGRVFKKVDQADDVDYPVITGVSLKSGDKEQRLKLAALVLASLELEKGQWSLEDLSEIHVERDGIVSLYFRSFEAVIRLRAAELGEKMDELKKIVEHLDRSGRIHMVRGINLNYRDGAAISFKKG